MAEKLRALVVHPDMVEAQVLTDALNAAAFEVEHVAHGPAAFAALLRAPFDLVVTEINLRRLDGFHVIEAAKSLAARAKIIALTGAIGKLSARALLDMARRMGANATLEKPHNPNQLTQLLRIMFGRAATA